MEFCVQNTNTSTWRYIVSFLWNFSSFYYLRTDVNILALHIFYDSFDCIRSYFEQIAI